MKKTLVGADNLEAYICKTSGKIYVDGTIILTSGAKDALSRKKIAIVYGPKPEAEAYAPADYAPAAEACPPGCTCEACTGETAGHHAAGIEELLIAVAAILKKQYGVNDPEELKTISIQIVKTIQENI